MDQLAFRFFKLFAQYEASLKSMGFFKVVDADGSVAVDWNRFANEVIGPDFIEQLGPEAEAAHFIFRAPPKRQVVDVAGRIGWKAVSDRDRSVQALFGHLSRMRNNLFHGSKFDGRGWIDEERSEALLSRGLRLLEFYKSRVGLH